MYYVYVAGYILLAAAMQLSTGNFPVSFLAFPLNIIFAAIWLFLLWILYKEYNNLRNESIQKLLELRVLVPVVGYDSASCNSDYTVQDLANKLKEL